MKAEELRQKSADELKVELGNLRAQVMKLRFSHASKELKDPSSLRSKRADVARIMTILTEKGASK